MFELDDNYWEIPLRTAVVYLAVLMGIRLTGKRQAGQMSAFDLVVIILIANAVQNAMVGADVSVIGGVLSAATLLALNYGVSLLVDRSKLMQRLIEGESVTLVNDGKVDWAVMRRERIDREELYQALREEGLENVEDVRRATLEVDGRISIVPATDPAASPGDVTVPGNSRS